MRIKIDDEGSLEASGQEEDREESPSEFEEENTREGVEKEGPSMAGADREKITKKELPRKKHDEIAKLNEMVANLTEELQKRESELVDEKDKALRAMADAENFKKRLSREREDERRYAGASLIEELLPVMDNFDNAISAAKADQAESKGLVEGVEMIRRQIMDVLQKHGLEKLSSVGKPFDPETMEAIHLLESGEHEDGEVVEEYIPGYKYADRVLRHAKVQVARNPGKEGEDSSD